VSDAAKTLSKPAATDLVTAAKAAFVHGSNVANVVGAIVVIVAAGLAFKFLPRARTMVDESGATVTDAEEAEMALIDTEPGVEGPEAWTDLPEPSPI
jgi:hypothetical protein